MCYFTVLLLCVLFKLFHFTCFIKCVLPILPVFITKTNLTNQIRVDAEDIGIGRYDCRDGLTESEYLLDEKIEK